METTHRVHVGDARSMDELADHSVELVVTSPPYPMIEMWDETFAELDPAVGEALEAGDGEAAYDAMHDLLAPVWEEVERVLAPGGVAAVNVGDAARKVDGEFRLWPNHVTVTEALTDLGLSPLPDVVWRKRANASADFMGSGMVPPNAYVTLEHEHVLIYRKGGGRTLEAGDEARYESAYFWEERNDWFSDLWTSVQGVGQALDADLRERSGAFPFELPFRLASMFSTYGDTVLDPFWGTGTTSLAAMVAGRSSVGYELDEGLVAAFDDRVERAPDRSREVARDRLESHRAFAAEHPGKVDYEATHYDTAVVTKQERDLRLYAVEEVRPVEDGYVAIHAPYED
jgi:DNA modification methylase